MIEGEVSECLVFNRTLSKKEVKRVERYLMREGFWRLFLKTAVAAFIIGVLMSLLYNEIMYRIISNEILSLVR